MRWMIDDETVHNWRNFKGALPYFDDLPEVARRAMVEAHDRHHQTTTAREELIRLAREFPDVFEIPPYIARQIREQQHGETHTARMARAAGKLARDLNCSTEQGATIIDAALRKLNEEERAELAEQMEADSEAWDTRDQR